MKPYSLKRLLSLVLALAMCLSLLPLSVFAEEPAGASGAGQNGTKSESTTQGTSQISTLKSGTSGVAPAAVCHLQLTGCHVTEGAKETYTAGDTVKISADLPEHHRFVSWDVTGAASHTAGKPGSLTVTFGTADVTVTAQTEAIPQHTLTVQYPGDKTVVSQHYEGETVTVAAEAVADHVFKMWEVAVGELPLPNADSQTVSFSMPHGDMTLKAHYAKLFTVTAEGSAVKLPGSSEWKSGVKATAGTRISIKPVLQDDQLFTGWELSTENGSLSPELPGEKTAFFMPEGDVTVTARYQKAYPVRLNGELAQKVPVDGTYTVPAGPVQEGMTFACWEDQNHIRYQPQAEVTPEGELNLTAFYKVTATFRVSGGTWADGTAQDKTEDFTIPQGGSCSITDRTPVGMKPADADHGYGAWDAPAPETISQDTVYTHSFLPVKDQEYTVAWQCKAQEDGSVQSMQRPEDAAPVKLTVSAHGVECTFEEADGKITARVPYNPEDPAQALYTEAVTGPKSYTHTVDKNKILMEAVPISYTVKLDSNTVVPSDLASLELTVKNEKGASAETPDFTLTQESGWTGSFSANPHTLTGAVNAPVLKSAGDTLNSSREGTILTLSGKKNALKTLTVSTVWFNSEGKKMAPPVPVTAELQAVEAKHRGEPTHKTLNIPKNQTSVTVEVPAFDILGNSIAYAAEAQTEGYAVTSQGQGNTLTLTFRQLVCIKTTVVFQDMDGTVLPWPADVPDVTVIAEGSGGEELGSLRLTAKGSSGNLYFPASESYNLWPEINDSTPYENYQYVGKQFNGSKDITFLFTAMGRAEIQVQWQDAEGKPLAPEDIPTDSVYIDVFTDRDYTAFPVEKENSWQKTVDLLYAAPNKILPQEIDGFSWKVQKQGTGSHAYRITYQKDTDQGVIPVTVHWKIAGKDGRMPDEMDFVNVDLVNVAQRETFALSRFAMIRNAATVPCSKKAWAEGNYTLEPQSVPGFQTQVTKTEQGFDLTYTYQSGGMTLKVMVDPDTVLAPDEEITVEIFDPYAVVTLASDSVGAAAANPRLTLNRGNHYSAQLELDRYDAQGKAKNYDVKVVKSGRRFTVEYENNICILRSQTQPAGQDVVISAQWQDHKGSPLSAPPAGAGNLTVAIGGLAAPRTVTLNQANNWTVTEKLPQYDGLTYKITGVPKNFRVIQKPGKSEFAIRHNPKMVEDTLQVGWFDCYGRTADWPKGQSVTLEIYDQADPTKTAVKTVEVTKAGPVALKDLPAEDISGKPIAFALKQPDPVTVAGEHRNYVYEPRLVKDKMAVQFIQRGLIQVDVKWQDKDGKAVVPAQDQIQFTMVSDGTEHTYTVTKAGKWTVQQELSGCTGIRMKDHERLDGYTSSRRGPSRKTGYYDYHYIITYVVNDNVQLLPVQIQWSTGGAPYTHLPEGITGATLVVEGKADGKVVHSQTRFIGGSGAFEVPVKTEEGKQIDYTVKGQAVPGFKYGEGEPKAEAGDPWVITYTQEGLPLRAGLDSRVVPSEDLELTISIRRTPGGPVLDTLVLNADNSWRKTGTKKLPVYDADGNMIDYPTQVSPAEYTARGNLKDGYVITTRQTVTTHKQEVTVIWKDKEGKLLTKPPRSSVVVDIKGVSSPKTRMIQAGVWEKSLTVSGNGNTWEETTEVPTTDAAGNTLKYTVTLHNKVPGYNTVYSGQGTEHVTITLQRAKASVIPRTGDDSHVGAWIAVGLCSVVGLASVGVVLTKKKKK